MAFNAASFKARAMVGRHLATFTGAHGTAIIETGESEANVGQRTFIHSVRAFVDVTANAITGAIGYRNNTQESVTYTSETTANSRSGEMNFRVDARFERVRFTITGTFNAAQGIDVDGVASGWV